MSRPRLIALLLALATLLVYLPVTRNGFVNYDDPDYVTNNQNVQNGLTWSGVQWAFTTWHASNWHPLTWLSFMLDDELFGLNPGAFHFVNVLFHAANAALLFLLLWRLANAVWPCAFIAALFAWHPLHVESVAWISERKDVLSTFFALLSLLSYAKFAGKNCRRSFWSALIFFALALMAKPMFVTLPFVMLLLDYWPLKRISFPSTLNFQFSTVFEKWPFFLLATVLCVVTYLAQRSAVIPLDQVSLPLRLENSLVAYSSYVFKNFWPVNLAFFYPLVPPAFWKLAASVIFLAAVSIFIWRMRRIYPWLLVGWCWFLGTLVPVIGLVQVGNQAMADRYSYFPSIGIFIMVAFGGRALAEYFKRLQWPLVSVAILMLAGCLLVMEKQLDYWRTDEALFGHAMAVTKNNEVAHLNLGVALEKENRKTEAMAQYRLALQLNPHRADTHNNIANLLDESGHSDEAFAEYQEALRLNPRAPLTHVNLGTLLVERGHLDAALEQFQTAAQLAPDDPRPHYQMGKTLLKAGRDVAAIGQFRQALRLAPDDFSMLTFTARVLAADENSAGRDGPTAFILATQANSLTGGEQPLVLDALGMACAETSHFDDAQAVAQKAVALALAASLEDAAAIQQRLELYKNHQPWRESFLATNASAGNFLKN